MGAKDQAKTASDSLQENGSSQALPYSYVLGFDKVSSGRRQIQDENCYQPNSANQRIKESEPEWVKQEYLSKYPRD